MSEIDVRPVNPLAVVGGIFLAIVIGLIAGFAGGLVNMSMSGFNLERGTTHPNFFGVLIAVLIPVVIVGGFWRLARKGSRGFGLGVLIGGSLVVLCCGICNVAMATG
jgi:hypothetical protein